MAEKPVETGGAKRSSRRGVTLAVVLFPLLVSAGALAPAWVQIALQSAAGAGTDVRDGAALGPLDRRPLPAPRDPAIGFTPVALELDRLFFETEFRGTDPAPDGAPLGGPSLSTPGEIAQLLSFPRHDTDPILLDQLGAPPEQIVF